MQVQSLGWEDSPEKEMAIHSRILAWRIPRTEDPEKIYGVTSQTWLSTHANLSLLFSFIPSVQQLNLCPKVLFLRAILMTKNSKVLIWMCTCQVTTFHFCGIDRVKQKEANPTALSGVPLFCSPYLDDFKAILKKILDYSMVFLIKWWLTDKSKIR